MRQWSVYEANKDKSVSFKYIYSTWDLLWFLLACPKMYIVTINLKKENK
jgi:hypothetical protein